MKNRLPVLSYERGKETYETFLLWSQILGKLKVATLPWVNHAWSVTLHVTPTGLTTRTLPFGDRYFQLNMDFVRHRLKIETDKGEERGFDLKDGLTVAGFYKQVFDSLSELGINVKIHGSPNEVVEAIPFAEDTVHHHYIEEEMHNFHKALLFANKVFKEFRAGFRGKSSPVHFFWGAVDLAVTRFSGDRAPEHPGGIPNLPDSITRECYSRELNSAGFWPGSEGLPEAAFYAYHYPDRMDTKKLKLNRQKLVITTRTGNLFCHMKS